MVQQKCALKTKLRKQILSYTEKKKGSSITSTYKENILIA